MEPENRTVKLLQEIRDDARSSARETREQLEKFSREHREQFERMDQRFEVIETSLRDLAQQLVMLASRRRSSTERPSTTDSTQSSVASKALEKAAH
ncbi:MAG: hypothetical protein JNM17_29455 [Archangium sp.]|nr:hypothetical protein [Archangium sp.]